MKYKITLTSAFKKELKKLKNKPDKIKKLTQVINMLSIGNKLQSKYKDHQLINYPFLKDCRECHIEPDLLLIYKINKTNLILLLIELGTHSNLFK